MVEQDDDAVATLDSIGGRSMQSKMIRAKRHKLHQMDIALQGVQELSKMGVVYHWRESYRRLLSDQYFKAIWCCVSICVLCVLEENWVYKTRYKIEL